MTSISLTDTAADLTPVRSSDRIQALDVVRGVALIGIFLMNVEYFNRPLNDFNGLPPSLTGANWLAGWFIFNFVQGKFWTMFSLLFGMGFAVMLTRAERAERNFIRPYLRRIAALAVFGAFHHIFIWGGDILFSYSVGAAGLLIILYGNWKYIAAAMAGLIGLSFIEVLEPLRGVAASLALISIAALFLRGEWKMNFLGRRIPVFSAVFIVLGLLMAIAALAFWLLPSAPKDPRTPLTVMSVVVLAIGLLSAKFHDPVEPRTRRLGVALYLFPFLMMTTFGTIQYLFPKQPPPGYTAAMAETKLAELLKADAAEKAGLAPIAKPASKAKQSEVEKYAERQAENAKDEKEEAEAIAKEIRIETSGTYIEAVRLRASEFAERAPGEAGFAFVLCGMFLLGAWFVRSGVMEDTAAHLPLFRKLAIYGIPVGVGLGLLAGLIADTRTPGLDNDPFQIAMGMRMIGNLPACLGYVGLMVLMLHSRSVFSNIKVFAPLGRMALTNYLTASIVGTLYFYGYGFGHWGMGRAWQVLFVAVVISLQLVFSHWWLARFRYGPMEWLWRAITYWQVPPMRREQPSLYNGGHERA